MKSIAAILALTSTTAVARTENYEGSAIATETDEVGADAGLLAVVSSTSTAAHRRQHRRISSAPRSRSNRNTTTKKKNGGGKKSRRKPAPRRLQQQQHQRQSTASSSSAAPGCGPTPGTHHSPYLGCYADKINDRAFPFELHESMSRSKRIGHGALDCERECSSRGYRYFGREYKGQCFCGNVMLEDIVRHGEESGCDCCGSHVGSGNKMCVWENANHPESLAQLPKIPIVSPSSHQSQQSVASQQQQLQSTHFHMVTASSISSSSYSNSNIINNHNHKQVTSTKPNNQTQTHKPIGAFRLRLHWQPGYNWQNNPNEQYFCMECRGPCKSGSSIQVDTCNNISTRQNFLAISRTIRPASNPALCLTVTGMADGGGGSTRDDPLKLRHCNRSSAQNFVEVRSNGKFELQPENSLGRRCLSQHHHPMPHEVVYPEICEKTRRFDTTYWTAY
ncbi:hypothetical protein ACHAXR_004004 [Thalassiosira sp. AJA248-18]